MIHKYHTEMKNILEYLLSYIILDLTLIIIYHQLNIFILSDIYEKNIYLLRGIQDLNFIKVIFFKTQFYP